MRTPNLRFFSPPASSAWLPTCKGSGTRQSGAASFRHSKFASQPFTADHGPRRRRRSVVQFSRLVARRGGQQSTPRARVETGGLLAAMGLTVAHVGTISDGPTGGGESAKISRTRPGQSAGCAQCLGRNQEDAPADGAAAETTSESLEPAIKLIPALAAIGVGAPATATNVAPGREPLQSPVEGSPAGRKVVGETEIPQKQADAFGHGAPTLFSAGPKVRAHHRPDAVAAEDPKPRCRSSFEDLPMAVAAPALPSPIEPPPVASTPAASAEVAVAPYVVLPAFEKNTAAVTNAGNGVCRRTAGSIDDG